MNRFEPPPLPGQDRQDQAPRSPYASPAAGGTVDRSEASGWPAPQAPWGIAAGYTHPQGTTVLVLGIISLMLPIVGPFAWVMGRKALKEADAAPQPAANRSTLQAGMALGIIGTVFLVMGALAFLLFMGLIIISSSTATLSG